jgi:hypothetical protein
MLRQTQQGNETISSIDNAVHDTLMCIQNVGTTVACTDLLERFISRSGLRGRPAECTKAIEYIDSRHKRNPPILSEYQATEAEDSIAVIETQYENVRVLLEGWRLRLRDEEVYVQNLWAGDTDGLDGNGLRQSTSFIVTDGINPYPYLLLKRTTRRKPLAEIALESFKYVKARQPVLFTCFGLDALPFAEHIREKYDLKDDVPVPPNIAADG